MAKEDQIIEALGTIKSSIRHIRRRTMRLGRYTNDVLDTSVNATLPANYVWVFDPQGDKRVSSPAKNLSTEYGVGMAVIVAYNVDSQEDDVIGVDTVLAPLENGAAAAGLNSPQKGANMPTPISARDIVVGGLFADSGGGLNVRIGVEWHEGGYYADSTALTLTPTATSGAKSLAVVGVNRLTNAATYTLTADRSLAFTLIANSKPTSYAVTDIMAVVAANPHIDWRGAVELANGATTINPAKIVPLPWLKAVMVGADGATAGVSGLVPKPAAADNVKALFGNGTWQSAIKADGTVAMTGDLNLNDNDLTNAATALFNEGAAPATPAANKVIIYAKSDGLMYAKDDAGTETPLGGGGSFSGDAFDVPYTPTTSGDWSSAPTEVGGALDTLAADVAALVAGTIGDYIILRDEQAQNTQGGTFTSGAWRTRVLNTEAVDTGGHCSLSSNQFTLAAGTYRITAYAPAFAVARNQTRLQNVTDGTTILIGTSVYAQSTTALSSSVSIVQGRFTIAGSKAFEIQHRCETTYSGRGFGVEANFTTEVYTVVELIREP